MAVGEGDGSPGPTKTKNEKKLINPLQGAMGPASPVCSVSAAYEGDRGGVRVCVCVWWWREAHALLCCRAM